jgi:hypothetical protein
MTDMPARLLRRPVSQFIALPRSVTSKGLHSREDATAATAKGADTRCPARHVSLQHSTTINHTIIPLNCSAREWYNPGCTDFCSQAAGVWCASREDLLTRMILINLSIIKNRQRGIIRQKFINLFRI